MSTGNRKQDVEEKPSFIWDLIFYISLACILVGLVLNQQNSGAPSVVGGYSVFHVLTSSMQAEIPKDSLVVTQMVDTDSLKIGDDITYMVGPSTSVTHRIVNIIENYSDGEKGFETKGLENKHNDSGIVAASNIVGKVIYHNYYLGRAGAFISHYWYLILIYLVLYIFIKKGILALILKDEEEEEPKEEVVDKAIGSQLDDILRAVESQKSQRQELPWVLQEMLDDYRQVLMQAQMMQYSESLQQAQILQHQEMMRKHREMIAQYQSQQVFGRQGGDLDDH